jgi:hypothetical protein
MFKSFCEESLYLLYKIINIIGQPLRLADLLSIIDKKELPISKNFDAEMLDFLGFDYGLYPESSACYNFDSDNIMYNLSKDNILEQSDEFCEFAYKLIS